MIISSNYDHNLMYDHLIISCWSSPPKLNYPHVKGGISYHPHVMIISFLCNIQGGPWQANQEHPLQHDRGGRQSGFLFIILFISSCIHLFIIEVADNVDAFRTYTGGRSEVWVGSSSSSSSFYHNHWYSSSSYPHIISTAGALISTACALRIGAVREESYHPLIAFDHLSPYIQVFRPVIGSM